MLRQALLLLAAACAANALVLTPRAAAAARVAPSCARVGPVRAAAFVASRRGSETDALDAMRRWRDDDGDDSVVDLCDDDDDDADDGEIAAYCAAHKWPPEDLVATYLADEPMPRRAFRWRRPSVDALAFANAERCVHGFHARPSLRYVLARVARLVD